MKNPFKTVYQRMFNEEYDGLKRMTMSQTLPTIAIALEQRNAIVVMTEAHAQGMLSDEAYQKFLEKMSNEISDFVA